MPELIELAYYLFTDDTQWLMKRWEQKLKASGRMHRVRGAPKPLYRVYGRLANRLFFAEKKRLRHRVALRVVRFTLDRFELYQFYGRPW